MSKKKVGALSAVVALLAVAIIGGTMAYFTDTASKDNVFTIGNIDIVLEEPAWDAAEHEDVYPGEALPKDPIITNVGENPCFVRAAIADVNGSGATFETNYVTGAVGEGWVNGGDGYYYYMTPLAGPYQVANEGMSPVTTKLFDQIRIPTAVTNGDSETQYNLQISVQAVQAQGAKPSWNDTKNISLDDLKAWFATCGFAA